jgi:hypothetical protein
MSTDALQQEAEEKEIILEEAEEQDQSEVQVAEEEAGVEEEPQAANEDELQEYSKNVQQRISKLTKKYRDEESARASAVEYAEAIKKQNDELKARLDALDQSYTSEFGTRVDSQIESAKQAYQKAYDDGDAEAMFDAQKNLSKLALDQAQLEQAKRRQESRAEQPVQEPVQQAQQQQRPAPPDPKAEEWAQKNEWFGADQTMTYAAFGLHRQLIEDEGFDPSSNEYYNELDNRMRKEFPHKFAAPAKSGSGPRVASAESTASRSKSTKGRRTVKLTPSQIAIAKRLNVPLEEYAKYVKE